MPVAISTACMPAAIADQLQPLVDLVDSAERAWERAPSGAKRKAALNALDAARARFEEAVRAAGLTIGSDGFAR